MDTTINPLIGSWHIQRFLAYAGVVVLGSLFVRLILAALKAFESSAGSRPRFCREFCKCFIGSGSKDKTHSDYWHPFILGLFELSAYPVLMATGNWTFIGAWLAFKTLAQWKRWEEKRSAFNRFLIGNLLVLFLSLLWLTRFVAVTTKKSDDSPVTTERPTGVSRPDPETNQNSISSGSRR